MKEHEPAELDTSVTTAEQPVLGDSENPRSTFTEGYTDVYTSGNQTDSRPRPAPSARPTPSKEDRARGPGWGLTKSETMLPSALYAQICTGQGADYSIVGQPLVNHSLLAGIGGVVA